MQNHSHNASHGHNGSLIKAFEAPALSLVMLIAGVVMNHYNLFEHMMWFEYVWYAVAFLPVGLPVMKEAFQSMCEHDYFNEFTLMIIACIGAFCIGEFPEAVGVMVFYSIGETLQHAAVDRATRNISSLLDVRGEHARVIRDGKAEETHPEDVAVGEMIEVRPGERVPLDGILAGGDGLFDTSALTGESMPRDIDKGGEVLAGMISSQSTVRIKVTRPFGESALSRILDMVKNASSRKAHAELYIRKFARIYTPVVILLAVLVVVVPAFVGMVNTDFHFVLSEWLYRALVFLVISCPCALVISVPLGYFAGIGAASRAGILFKGGNYLEALTKTDTVAFDKTGTLTTGVFSVVKVESSTVSENEMLSLMASAESVSSHPLAKALCGYTADRNISVSVPEKTGEKTGYGTYAVVNGRKIVVGNLKMMKYEGIICPTGIELLDGTILICGIDGNYAGYVLMSDTVKPDASEAISDLHKLGIDRIVMLSGDKKDIVLRYASMLGIDEAYGEMLPQDKAEFVEHISSMPGRSIAFVGDGMNDAPVLAVSNVGIAMGGLGSDAAIESADVVIQTDKPSRVATAIKIGRVTHTIVTENIVGAIAIKVIILVLGAMGYASLWAAVFADVGVALLAILNSMRIMWKKY